MEQKQLMLICEALSFPVATITWIHNGTEMSLCLQNKSDDCIGKNYKVIQTVDEELATSRSYLIIVKTKYPKDNGNYTCVATNSKNSDKKSMEVSIESMYNHTSVEVNLILVLQVLKAISSFVFQIYMHIHVARSRPPVNKQWLHKLWRWGKGKRGEREEGFGSGRTIALNKLNARNRLGCTVCSY